MFDVRPGDRVRITTLGNTTTVLHVGDVHTVERVHADPCDHYVVLCGLGAILFAEWGDRWTVIGSAT